jgi:hypothetical protein
VIERSGARWAAMWLMTTAFPWRTGFLLLLCALTGLLPGLFALAVGQVLNTIPGAARDGLEPANGPLLIGALAVAAGVLLLGEVLGLVVNFHTMVYTDASTRRCWLVSCRRV